MARNGPPEPYPVTAQWLRVFAQQVGYAAKRYLEIADEIEKFEGFESTGKENAEVGLRSLNTFSTTLQRMIHKRMGDPKSGPMGTTTDMPPPKGKGPGKGKK